MLGTIRVGQGQQGINDSVCVVRVGRVARLSVTFLAYRILGLGFLTGRMLSWDGGIREVRRGGCNRSGRLPVLSDSS